MEQTRREHRFKWIPRENEATYRRIFAALMASEAEVLTTYGFTKAVPESKGYEYTGLQYWFEKLQLVYGTPVKAMRRQGWGIYNPACTEVEEQSRLNTALDHQWEAEVLQDFIGGAESIAVSYEGHIDDLTFSFLDIDTGLLPRREIVIVSRMTEEGKHNYGTINFKSSALRKRLFESFIRNGGYIDVQTWKHAQSEEWYLGQRYQEHIRMNAMNRNREVQLSANSTQGKDFRALTKGVNQVLASSGIGTMKQPYLQGLRHLGGLVADGDIHKKYQFIGRFLREYLPLESWRKYPLALDNHAVTIRFVEDAVISLVDLPKLFRIAGIAQNSPFILGPKNHFALVYDTTQIWDSGEVIEPQRRLVQISEKQSLVFRCITDSVGVPPEQISANLGQLDAIQRSIMIRAFKDLVCNLISQGFILRKGTGRYDPETKTFIAPVVV